MLAASWVSVVQKQLVSLHCCSQSFASACRLRLDQVCRAWNKELHTAAAAAAAWQTLSLSQRLYTSIGIVGKAGLMAAWAIRHRDFVSL